MKKFICLLLFFTFVQCASWNQKSIADIDNPQELYKRGEASFKDKDYLIANEAFAELRKKFPQSHFVQLSELRIADMQFEQGQYAEAASLYDVFIELYPRHAESHYAYYKKAKSYFEDAPSHEARDQIPTQLAISVASQLLVKFPDSPYAKEAQTMIQKGRFVLGKKGLYVARFYLKKNKKEAALRRYGKFLKQYGDLQNSPLPEAKILFKEAESEQNTLLNDKEVTI